MSTRGIRSSVVMVAWMLSLAAAATRSHAAAFAYLPANDRDGFSDVGAAGPYTLRADGQGALIVGSGFDTQARLYRSGMEFDLLGTFPQVLSAQLSFTFEVVQNPPAGFLVHGYAGDGAVSAGDLLTNNALTPVQTTPTSFATPYVVDVTAYVQQLVTSNERYAGFTLTGFPGGSGFAIRSSEPFVGSPLLTIQAVPEPLVAPFAFVAVARIVRRRGRA